jgi:peptidoglycan/xylan/chitin deacetylase (PgdA/CDA1 family)
MQQPAEDLPSEDQPNVVGIRGADMNKRTIILGGAVAAVVVVSAAAYGIAAALGWWSPDPAAQVAATTPRIAPPPTQIAASSPRVAAPAPIAPPPLMQTPPMQPTTVAQAPPSAPSVVAAAPATTATTQAIPAMPSGGAAPVKSAACTNPNALGVSRVVEIDPAGGPGFGSQHFKTYDFLRDHEVVLTFDDGPWPGNTQAVLKALADQCLRATFFPIGKHATYHPEILKMVFAAGNTVGSHTWSHADLAAVVKKSGVDAAKDEIEKGASAVHLMARAPIAPFFRFPDLRHPPEMMTYLAERNVATFSTDIDSWDFKIKKPEELVKSLMGKLDKQGKAIILMHDFQKVTAIALPQILAQLRAKGYKVVHMVPRGTLTTLPQYDEAVLKEDKLTPSNARPQESVVRTISGQ